VTGEIAECNSVGQTLTVQPLEPVQPTIQEDAEDFEARQEQIHDAEDAIVDEADEEELGEAV
jgi:hypothetical protein